MLGYHYVVCHTCRTKHPARTDRLEAEMLEFVARHRAHSVSVRPEWWDYLVGWRYRGNANIKQAFGSSSAITTTLASLASGATTARGSTAIDNTSDLYLDAFVYLAIALQAGSPANDKAIYVYAGGSEDGTNYTDNYAGTDAAVTLRAPTNLKLIGVIATPDSGGLTYKSHPMSVAAAFGGMLPRNWGIIVNNFTGVALHATEGNHTKSSSGLYATSV